MNKKTKIPLSQRIGLSTATYFGKSLTEESLALIADTGAQVCEIFLTTYSEYRPEFANLLKQKLAALPQLKVHSVHTLNSQFEPQLYNRAPRTYRDALDVFESALSVARELGAKNYTFHGVARLKKLDNNFDYAALGRRTAELCEVCKSYGVTLCFENVHWAYYSFAGFFQNLLAHCPELYACLDIKQAMQSRADYKAFAEDMQGRIRTVHICDYNADGSLTLPGRGIFDFDELFRVLEDNGCSDAPILLELYSENYADFKDVKRAYDFVCGVAAKYF